MSQNEQKRLLILLSKYCKIFNPFSTNVPLLYPLKTSENQRFSDFPGGIDVEHWLKMGNPFNTTGLFLHPLKLLGKPWISGMKWGYKMSRNKKFQVRPLHEIW